VRHSAAEQQERPAPKQPGGRLHRRPVTHEVAIAGHHEVEDFLVRLALADQRADLAPQVLRQFGMRAGEGFVLANQAAQFFADRHHALFDLDIGRHRRGFLRHRRAAENQHDADQPVAQFHAAAPAGTCAPALARSR
jgi:hypothetical protein